MKYFDIRTLFLLYKNSLKYYPKIENKLKQQSVKYLAHVYKTTPCITLNIVSFIEPEYLIYLFKNNTIHFYQSILFNDIKRLNNVFKQTIDHELVNKEINSYNIMNLATIEIKRYLPNKFDISASIHLYQQIGYLLQEFLRDLSWENRRKEISRYKELSLILKNNFYIYYLWIDYNDMCNLTSTLLKINYHLEK